MAGVIKTLVALDSGVDRTVVEQALPIDAAYEIVGVVEGIDESWSVLQETSIDLILLACAGYSDRALFFLENAVKQMPERPVVVLCDGSPNGFVRRVFEAGADDLVTLPESSERVSFSLQKVLARRQGAAAATATALSPLICVIGPKGGTGKTLTTANLGVSLASSGASVAAVDLDLQFGDLGLSLGLAPESTIYDLARSGGSLDAEKVDAFLATHSSGLRVLLAPTRPDQATSVTVEFLRELYPALRSRYDYVVVDTPPGFTPEVIASIDASTAICMVGMLDALSLKNTRLGLETLDLMGYDRSRVRLLLNRADSRVGIRHDDVQSILGVEPDVLVPSTRDISRSTNQGTPIVLAHQRSEAARAFRQLGEMFVNGRHPVEAAKSNGGRRLFRRRT